MSAPSIQERLDRIEAHLGITGAPAKPEPSIAAIAQAVANRWLLPVGELTGRSREVRLSPPRAAIVFLARRLTSHSRTVIGRTLGGREHTTILHFERMAEELMRDDATFARRVRSAESRLSQGEGQ